MTLEQHAEALRKVLAAAYADGHYLDDGDGNDLYDVDLNGKHEGYVVILDGGKVAEVG